MEIYVLGHNKMGQTGESLLKLIQNTSLSTIDLLVRESIQNSLDAAKTESTKVTLNILTGDCQRQELDAIFSGITEALRKKIPGNEASYIAIRDSGTVGLTGPLREAEVKHEKDFGNLRKLIYEICQAQPEEGKGGSWGLGKTVYFRVGIGIVLYYSRIKQDDGTYASRMAAALIEDNSREDSLLRMSGQKTGNFYCGVAWWGALDQDNDTMPITDEAEISRILEIFDIEPYEEDETGTTVIIPYIDRKKLHDEANVQSFSVFDHYSLEEMINLSVQRWYAPRLYNNNYQYGAFLDYRCNDQKLRGNDRVKFFSLLQKLYNEADKGMKIGVNNMLADGNCAGYLNCCVVPKKELDMSAPNNAPSPLQYLLKQGGEGDDNDSNPPILAYCRKAGMIVNYELRGEWVTGVQPTRDDEYLIAFFVLNGDNKMLNDPQLSLDEYIRRGEKADHMSWNDHVVNGNKYQVVSRIHKGVSKKLKEAFAPEDKNTEKHNDPALQKLMGACFLPSQNFGRLANAVQRKSRDGASPNVGKNRKAPGINDVRKKFLSENKIELTWTVIMKKKQSMVIQEIMAKLSKMDTAISWEHDVGLPFPFNIEQVEASCKNEPVKCSFIRSENDVNYGFRMDTNNIDVSKKEKAEIKCHMIAHCNDTSVSCHLSIRELAE